MQTQNSVWYLYIIRAASQSLYTGITTDVERRFNQHQTNKGAKHLKGKGPLSIVYQIRIGDRSTALKLEYRIKQLSKIKKERLVQDQPDLKTLLMLLTNQK